MFSGLIGEKEKTVLEVRGSGPDGPEPLARREGLETVHVWGEWGRP